MAFPLTEAHVISLVQFANKSDICVSVAGTGHDFLIRHSTCHNGLLIRMLFFKDIEHNVT